MAKTLKDKLVDMTVMTIARKGLNGGLNRLLDLLDEKKKTVKKSKRRDGDDD